MIKLKITSNQRWWPRSIYFQLCFPRVITITRNKPRGAKLKIYRPVFCMEPPLDAGEELQRLTISWRLRMAFEQKEIFIELCQGALVLELLTPTTPPRTHDKVAKWLISSYWFVLMCVYRDLNKNLTPYMNTHNCGRFVYIGQPIALGHCEPVIIFHYGHLRIW